MGYSGLQHINTAHPPPPQRPIYLSYTTYRYKKYPPATTASCKCYPLCSTCLLQNLLRTCYLQFLSATIPQNRGTRKVSKMCSSCRGSLCHLSSQEIPPDGKQSDHLQIILQEIRQMIYYEWCISLIKPISTVGEITMESKYVSSLN